MTIKKDKEQQEAEDLLEREISRETKEERIVPSNNLFEYLDWFYDGEDPSWE